MEPTNMKPITETDLPKAEQVFADATEENTTAKPAKKETIKKRPRAREINELVDAATKNMSDKEKEKLIDHLKSENFLAEQKIEALHNNCEKAYEKLRRCEEEYQAMERYYKERLGYIDQQLTAFGNAVKLSIVGGLN